MLGLVKRGDSYQINESEVTIPIDLGRVSFNFVTADPIHYGHMEMARTVLDEYADTVLFPLHNYYPPKDDAEYRAKYPAPYEHRLQMLRLGIEHMTESDIRIEGNLGILTPSDFNQTSEELFECLKQLAEQDAERMFFVIGSSSLITNRFQQLTRDLASWNGVKLLINDRKGYESPDLSELEKYGFLPELCNLENLGISSSEIRRRVKKNESIHELTPSPIIEYIEKHKLYLEQ